MAEPTENNVAASGGEEAPVAAPQASSAASASDAESTEASNGVAVVESAQGAPESNADAAGDEGGDEAGDDASADDASAASGAEGGEGKKKRRRRRKRKGGGQTLTGEASPHGEGGGEGRPRKRDGAMAPLQRFFGGTNAGKRHGFAVGEVVAGRVKEVGDGVIVVDLFGKALALVDEHEPREVPVAPVAPEPVVEASAPAEASATAEAQAQPEPSAEAASGEPQPSSPEAAPLEAAALESAPVEAAHDVAAVEAQDSSHAAAAEAAAAVDEEHDEEHDEHETMAGGRGPMTPLPIVPEALGRPEAPPLGQVFRGRVGATSESGHIALVNRLIDRKEVLAELEHCRVSRRRVEGIVFGFNRGGFDVLVAGMRAFCPASAMALSEIADPNEHVGRKYEFLLAASQAVADDVIVSRRSILERLQRKAAREMLKGLNPGQKFKGRVTQVREFGLIVDIGGVEGLVHQSELSWAHGVRPEDVAKPGDEVEVQVLRIGGEPGGRGDGPQRRDRMTRVGLSIKALLPDPWDAHQDALREGCVQKGKITRTTDFGAFVQLAPEIEGLLHITELGRDLKHASMAVNEGDDIHVVVERVDRRARRIALSRLSPAEVAEFEAGALEEGNRAVRPGSRVTVKVERVEQRGLLVRLQGVVGRRARGYVPRSEMGEAGAGDMRKSFPQGSTLEVKVVGIDRDGGLRCSPKALAVDDERKAIKDYRREAARQGFGTFGDLLRAKLGEAGPK